MTGPAPGDAGRRAPRHAMKRRLRGRRSVLVIVGAIVVVVAVVDAALSLPAAAPPAAPSDGVALSGAGAYSSSAFCAGGTGTAAATTVYLTNTTPHAVSGVMTGLAPVGANGSASTTRRSLSVPPLATSAVDPASGLPSGSNASIFTFDGGGVAVSQVVSGPGGWSTAPCASQTSADWAFAGGSTASGNLLTLSLLNPASTDSVVNVSFLTDSGMIVPQAYQALTIPAGRLVTENVGDYVQNTGDIATMVTAQSGSLISTELQQWSPGGTGGLSLRLGSPALATTWRFAQTTAMQGSTVDFYLANPQDTPATATLSFGLSSGAVEPLQVAIGARSVSTVSASSIQGLPRQVPFAVTVEADQPIVAGRSVLAPGGSAVPVWGASSGTVATARRWIVPGPGVPGAPGTAGATVHSLAIADPGTDPAQVTVTRLGERGPGAVVSVASGGLTVLGPDRVAGLSTFLVSSSQPVVVEQDSAPSGAPGVVSTSGFPLAG